METIGNCLLVHAENFKGRGEGREKGRAGWQAGRNTRTAEWEEMRELEGFRCRGRWVHWHRCTRTRRQPFVLACISGCRHCRTKEAAQLWRDEHLPLSLCGAAVESRLGASRTSCRPFRWERYLRRQQLVPLLQYYLKAPMLFPHAIHWHASRSRAPLTSGPLRKVREAGLFLFTYACNISSIACSDPNVFNCFLRRTTLPSPRLARSRLPVLNLGKRASNL